MHSRLLTQQPRLVRWLCIVMASTFLVAAVAAWAADPSSESVSKAEVKHVEDQPASELSVAEREARDVLRDLTIQRNAEIETALASVQIAVDQLQLQYADTVSPSEKMALQRATEEAKIASQIEVMRIQARYADLAGKPDVAQEIREEADHMEQVAADRSQAYRQ